MVGAIGSPLSRMSSNFSFFFLRPPCTAPTWVFPGLLSFPVRTSYREVSSIARTTFAFSLSLTSFACAT